MNVCFYCGELASVLDHVVPLSRSGDVSTEELYLRSDLDRLTVPACRECNNLLADTLQESLQERFLFLKSRLERRLSKQLSCVLTENDLIGMRPAFKSLMRKGMQARDLAKRRLAWPMADIDTLPPDQSVSVILGMARRRARV